MQELVRGAEPELTFLWEELRTQCSVSTAHCTLIFMADRFNSDPLIRLPNENGTVLGQFHSGIPTKILRLPI